MILTIEYNSKGVVEITCDTSGVDFLMKKLESLKKHGGHDHFATPAWAENELTENRFNLENSLINQLNITLKS
ncbi:MAG: Imm32 family immunity protein [Chlamydiota bacterium]|nr:Imm32 family immunity protein [Chlamydiota bacterium]